MCGSECHLDGLFVFGLHESATDPTALNCQACVVRSHPVPNALWGKAFPLNLAAGGRPPAGTCGTASPRNRALVSAFVPFVRCSHRDRTKTSRSLCERSARSGLDPAAVLESRR